MTNQLHTIPQDDSLRPLIDNISKVLQAARTHLAQQVNSTMTKTYWQIGKYIVEYEQGGAAKVGYGESTLKELSHRLTTEFGRGFSRLTYLYMRKFYLTYPNVTMFLNYLYFHIRYLSGELYYFYSIFVWH